MVLFFEVHKWLSDFHKQSNQNIDNWVVNYTKS